MNVQLPTTIRERLESEQSALVARLENGWQQVAAAKENNDPRAGRWEDAWVAVLHEYELVCDTLASHDEADNDPLAVIA